ncbi:MAG: YggT family protein [Lentisphaerae bacterium]|nr:YggT family protein [Lentisphaerota bacterium]
MRYGTWDTLFNVLVLIFWFRLWQRGGRAVVFNPYLAPLGRAADAAVRFLQPVFVMLRPRAIAALAVVFLLVLRGLAAPASGNAWILRFGFSFTRPGSPAWSSAVVFSFLSFGIFLYKLWGLSLLYAARGSRDAVGYPRETLHELARPFSAQRPEWRPFCFLASGLLLAGLLHAAGRPVSTPFLAAGAAAPAAPLLVIRWIISALAAWVDLLLLIRTFLIVLIIGSWIAMFATSPGIAGFCRDWTELILGPFRRFPVRIGMLDLTPLVFLLAIQLLVYPLLMGLLLFAYTAAA